MTVRDEIKALIDKLPESNLRIAKAFLLRNEAEDRFRKEFRKQRSETILGRSGWSGVHNGLHVAGQSVHRVQKNNELIVQTLYSYDGHQIEITEKFSLAARKTKWPEAPGNPNRRPRCPAPESVPQKSKWRVLSCILVSRGG